jgi:endo-1,4-beta-mannosidase
MEEFQCGNFGGINGKFRIVRTGSTVMFKFYRDNVWVDINTQYNWGMPVSLYVFCQSTEPSHTFTTYFDNFVINSCANPSTPFINTSLLPKADSTKLLAPAPQLPPVKLGSNGFTIDGKSFHFIGANSSNLPQYPDYGLSIDDAISEASQNGINVIRIYLWSANQPWQGTMEDMDTVLDSAARHGVYVIAVLADMCPLSFLTKEENFSFFNYEDLASQSALDYYKSVVGNLLTRKNVINGKIYKDDTTIMAWDVANEPALFWFDPATIHNWLSQATDYIKSIDPNHMVTMGTGMGGTGDIFDLDKAYYEALNVPGLDFFSYHLYPPDKYTAQPPGSSDQYLDLIKTRAQAFLAMGKPVVLEEFGFTSYRTLVDNLGRAPNNTELQQWLAVYKDQMDAAFNAGASGAMFWGWGVPDSKFVPQYWYYQEHDMTETEFCNMIRNYFMPAPTSK